MDAYEKIGLVPVGEGGPVAQRYERVIFPCKEHLAVAPLPYLFSQRPRYCERYGLLLHPARADSAAVVAAVPRVYHYDVRVFASALGGRIEKKAARLGRRRKQ